MATEAHTSTALASLSEAGVSVWLDELSRDRIRDGELAQDVEERSVVGVTTNPSIFAAAVSGSDLYDPQISDLAARGVTVDDAVRTITATDVREACDVMRPVFDRTDGVDGRVSIEVDPRLASDTHATIAEARYLWWLVDRPNVMIKIPATREGLPAITAALAEGISVNVTLIFSLERYREVIDAFLEGMERADAAGHDVSKILSVASFFVSRVDSKVDALLDEASPGHQARGAAAIANARLAMELHEQTLETERFAALAAKGAHPQRPLWASTSVKDDAYPDTMYVDELVTKGVVNTMPMSTLNSVGDHGQAPSDPASWDTVSGTYDSARATLKAIEEAGVSMTDVTAALEDEGVEKFVASWQELLDHVKEAMAGQ
ncbi:transaldolase [Demequina sp. TTPB684]|uniref:transaldolase n=1 Tax=unclassified Demequina TaxID=2620311 RepID=UPI001CF5F23C|nr:MULTISPECIES: transaldolase [unclassified Demequina]MCB2413046.1 transaldolase [Demequina sp. TTPB684]UPU89463.1 transaldolase [Demequina sp. TMPB413]